MTGELRGARTISQWAKITGIPYNSIRRAVQAGLITGYQFKPRGQIYVTPDAIDEFVEQAKARPVLEQEVAAATNKPEAMIAVNKEKKHLRQEIKEAVEEGMSPDEGMSLLAELDQTPKP